MSTEMDTFSARLASFDIVLRPDKRRSSNSKGPNAIAWSHDSPSSAQLAQAGFYYKPYESNPDNTVCFHCSRALDGWEEDDNPITEHLKHSPECGWAIMMDIQQSSSNPKKIEDPTSERIVQARAATFGTSWPHDGKKGWVCQSVKMVESGWYFCPNDDSDDLASCAYCKLSLDGWEPKDDPYDEHFRRSSDCSFFVFARNNTKKGKTIRGKRGRPSKASSRLSTQSVVTTTSEAPEMYADTDMDASDMDQSIMSQASTKPKPLKRGRKPKAKSAKAKEEEVGSQMDVDNVQPESDPEPPKPKRAGRGKKRASEELNHEETESVLVQEREQFPGAEPPSKRRVTARSSSVSRSYDYEPQDHDMQDSASVNEAPQEKTSKRGRKPKKTGPKSRKASDMSAASKSSVKERLPSGSEIDAAIEAGLEADPHDPAAAVPESEQEPEFEPAPPVSKKSKTSKKSKNTEKAAVSPELDDQPAELPQTENYEETGAMIEDIEEPAPKTKSTKSSKKKGSKKSQKEETMKTEKQSFRDSVEPTEIDDYEPEDERHSPVASINQGSESEEKPVTKKSSKKDSSKKNEKSKKSKKSKKELSSPEPEVEAEPEPEPELEHDSEPEPEPQPELESEMDRELHSEADRDPPHDPFDMRSPSMSVDEFGTPGDMPDQVEMIPSPHPPSSEHRKGRTPVPPKTTKRFSDIPQEEHLAESFSESQNSRGKETQESKSQRTSKSSNRAVSPLPPRQRTPSFSPQSSDAENRPPSSRPSTSQNYSVTPKQQTTRDLAVAATPSPSKRNPNAGFPGSSHPWTPIDIDEILYGEPSDKENADLSGLFKGIKAGLTSPEKKMSVEQWIMWNAKNGEERLKRECERLVSQFEKEGGRAMQRLEAIECMD
ncbi:hypothetical protein N7450_009254 [Penicillium hetheringtonii]|uniref:Chromosome segregation protein BIR1 n=1 Tax=Penicillium hetheringtonii TaxID=911720 RepID=A0AAD6GNA5_9EURO|nr:hypothetical protein N7450_009254 [Penicillium hetheringtonii]